MIIQGKYYDFTFQNRFLCEIQRPNMDNVLEKWSKDKKPCNKLNVPSSLFAFYDKFRYPNIRLEGITDQCY